MDNFKTRLKELRLEKGLTQKQLAKELNTTDDSIFSWEKARSQPSLDMIRKICLFFDVTSDYLIGLEDETGSRIQIANSFNNISNSNIKF